MINALVRTADAKDQQQLSNLIFFETRLHRHLDWRAPLEWLGAPFFWALEEGSRITAALACPMEIEGIAWLRLFVHSSHWSADNAWSLLWHTAQDEISRAGGAVVAVIAMQPWFQTLLGTSGFEIRQRIVMLEWQYQPWAAREADGVHIRKMYEEDLPRVEWLDAEAFDSLWHNPLPTLRRAFSQAVIATVAESQEGIIGYQLTTGGGARAHLARLAVHPSVQGRGIGAALLDNLFRRLTHGGISRLTVNTQNDNAASLNLYQKMGFTRTGEQYPVYTFDIPAIG